jgi:threonine dehydrogenase-like Zn-dependent dehydrogenase
MVKGEEMESRIVFSDRNAATLESYRPDDSPLGEDEVVGRTVVSLLSAGTEIALYKQARSTPLYPGYAAVFRVDRVGRGVAALAPGDLAFCMGPHQSTQRLKAHDALRLPEGLAPESAVFARMANMALTAIATSAARPPQLAFVSGLGLIGLMSAQALRVCGYTVLASDASETRRRLARAAGIERLYPDVPTDDPEVAGRVSLYLDCTGRERSVLDGCRVVHRGGEVSLVGVPWEPRGEQSAHELISLVFHRYVRLRSGWEWELPLRAEREGQPNIDDNLRAALSWLADGRLRVDGLAEVAAPADAAETYRRIAERRRDKLATVFDWRR